MWTEAMEIMKDFFNLHRFLLSFLLSKRPNFINYEILGKLQILL